MEIKDSTLVNVGAVEKTQEISEEKPIYKSKKIFVYVITLLAFFYATGSDTAWEITAAKSAFFIGIFVAYSVCKSATDVAFIMAHAESLLERDPNKSVDQKDFYPEEAE